MRNPKEERNIHEPVLVKEVIEGLRVRKLARSKVPKFIDATLGLGGHAIEIIKSGGCVLGIEADPNSLKIAKKRLREACPSSHLVKVGRPYKVVHGNFREIGNLAKRNGFEDVDGILFDLGISSFQLEESGRGFSFQNRSEILDMRIDPSKTEIKALDLLRVLDKTQLTDLFATVLEPNLARSISKKIVEERKIKDINTVADFLGVIKSEKRLKKRLNLATLPFLALRIAVNTELDNLKIALPQSFDILRPKGRILVISFHSGEDRIVKNFFRQKIEEKKARLVNKSPIIPTIEEVERNSRSRSAKLRILEKL